MGGYLVAVFDAAFMFSGGTSGRFVVVFLISSVVAAAFFYLWAVEIKGISAGRERARLKLESLSVRQAWLLAIGLLILAAVWLIDKLSWL